MTIRSSGNPIQAVAFRPDNRQLYGVSRSGIYTIDPTTGNTTRVSDSPHAREGTLGFLGADFDPGTANLRVVWQSFQGAGVSFRNERVNVDTGFLAQDGPVPAHIVDIAWGQAPGSIAPALYGFGAGDALLRIDPFTGVTTTLGQIPALVQGAGLSGAASLTFSSLTGTAYLIGLQFVDSSLEQVLYNLDLQSGASTLVGVVDHFPPGALFIAAPNTQSTVPEPSAWALVGLASLFLLSRLAGKRAW